MKLKIFESKIRLPKEFRSRWLEMLNSGKYTQTTTKLSHGGGYCCLGVAGRALGIRKCDLVGGMPNELDDKFARKYPKAIVARYETEDINNCGKTFELFEETSFSRYLVQLNDVRGLTFKQIAKYIRSNTKGV